MKTEATGGGRVGLPFLVPLEQLLLEFEQQQRSEVVAIRRGARKCRRRRSAIGRRAKATAARSGRLATLGDAKLRSPTQHVVHKLLLQIRAVVIAAAAAAAAATIATLSSRWLISLRL